MHHFIAPPESQGLADLARLETGDLPGVTHIIGDEPAGNLVPRLAHDTDRIAPGKDALDAAHPGRKQALAARQRTRRPGVDDESPHRHEGAGNPALARLEWRGLRQEPRRSC